MTGQETNPPCIAPLFVPGCHGERFAKAANSEADAVIIDLEDSVPVAEKAMAQAALKTDFTPKPIYVRINGAGTAWHLADLEATSRLRLAGIVVPKADSATLRQIRTPHPIVALVETALGLATAREVAADPRVARLAFGSVDFCSDIGCAHTQQALLVARTEIVLASRLASLAPPLDGVTLALDNAALTETDARHAAELGFGGKLCIHPKQIAPVMRGFQPDEADIAWARKIVSAADGASAVDGLMVDAPVRARARAILRRTAPTFRAGE